MNVMLGSKTQSAVEIDDYDLKEALQQVSKFGTDRFGYVVTPNVDHIIRHHYDQSFRDLYAQASYVFLDSRFLAHIIVWVKQRTLRVCRGSDLTAAVLSSVIQPLDTVVLVGSTAAQAQLLREKYGLEALHHINPPMNFIHDPVAVETCLQQIEAVGKFRFCFLAIGSPQQEILAQLLKSRGKARGLALCVGASIDFVTGIERRAPGWMQEAGFEWLYRLTRNPRRLWRRYLVRGPRIFLLLWQIELRIRRPATLPETIPGHPLPSNPAASGALPVVATPTS
jgi:exopolysaccharide biosynthesis WecB/TagA/CpsF family protein